MKNVTLLVMVVLTIVNLIVKSVETDILCKEIKLVKRSVKMMNLEKYPKSNKIIY